MAKFRPPYEYPGFWGMEKPEKPGNMFQDFMQFQSYLDWMEEKKAAKEKDKKPPDKPKTRMFSFLEVVGLCFVLSPVIGLITLNAYAYSYRAALSAVGAITGIK